MARRASEKPKGGASKATQSTVKAANRHKQRQQTSVNVKGVVAALSSKYPAGGCPLNGPPPDVLVSWCVRDLHPSAPSAPPPGLPAPSPPATLAILKDQHRIHTGPLKMQTQPFFQSTHRNKNPSYISSIYHTVQKEGPVGGQTLSPQFSVWMP